MSVELSTHLKKERKKMNNQKLTHEFVPVEQVLKLEMRLARANFISVSFGYQAISAVLVHHFSNDVKIQKNVVCKRQEESEGRLFITPEDQMKGTRAIDPPVFLSGLESIGTCNFFPLCHDKIILAVVERQHYWDHNNTIFLF